MMVIDNETCRSCFIVNFNILLKQHFCAPVSKLNFDSIKMHSTTVKIAVGCFCKGNKI